MALDKLGSNEIERKLDSPSEPLLLNKGITIADLRLAGNIL